MLTPLQKHIITGIMIVSCLLVDYLLGPYFAFPVTFILPIVFTAWWYGRWVGIGVATVMAAARVGCGLSWDLSVANPVAYVAINAVIREIVFVVLVLLVDQVATQQRKLERDVKLLEGILPICSFCKKIRNDEGEWEQIEHYISRHSAAQFSHSLCSNCREIHYGSLLKKPVRSS